jgi:transcription elongation factor Elf1
MPEEIGSCSLCRSIIYADDSGAVELDNVLYCSITCAEESTGKKVLTGYLYEVKEKSTPEESEYNYLCPHCGKVNGMNEGCTVSMHNGRVMTGCAYCGQEAITKEVKIGKENWQVDNEPEYTCPECGTVTSDSYRFMRAIPRKGSKRAHLIFTCPHCHNESLSDGYVNSDNI